MKKLLLSTLFRLSLNIASTRLILLHEREDHPARRSRERGEIPQQCHHPVFVHRFQALIRCVHAIQADNADDERNDGDNADNGGDTKLEGGVHF